MDGRTKGRIMQQNLLEPGSKSTSSEHLQLWVISNLWDAADKPTICWVAGWGCIHPGHRQRIEADPRKGLPDETGIRMTQ